MKFYHYPSCSTCKKAKKWLEARSLLTDDVEILHIVDAPPSRETIEKAWAASGLDLKRFFNTSGQSYRALDLKNTYKSLSDSERLDLLAADGKLLKRPLLIEGEDRALVGFKPDEYEAFFGEGEEVAP